jgi:hypothetical protein
MFGGKTIVALGYTAHLIMAKGKIQSIMNGKLTTSTLMGVMTYQICVLSNGKTISTREKVG